MAVVVNSRDDFTVENYRRVAMVGEPVTLGPEAHRAMVEGRANFLRLLESDRTQFIYGVTSSFGPRAKITLPPDQQEILTTLLGAYLHRLPDDAAEAEQAKVTGPAAERLHFAWAGSIEPRQPHYYRIHAPRLLAEYDNTQRGGNHVHSVWRDPAGDFGRDLLTLHYATSH